jgi:REP element-mobilizing transposase RayT
MPDKFLNKYRIQSTRLGVWDYKYAAAYFITICTHNREHYFGQIDHKKMHLSPTGKIVESEWLNTPEIRPDMNLKLDEFVVMPNHFHGILIIGDNQFNKTTDVYYDDGGGPSTNQTVPTKNKFGPQSKNVGSIIRGFKSAVTNQVKKLSGADVNGHYPHECHDNENTAGTMFGWPTITTPFAWQPRFHDHIIRDDNSFERIRRYIINNPLNWKEDKFY